MGCIEFRFEIWIEWLWCSSMSWLKKNKRFAVKVDISELYRKIFRKTLVFKEIPMICILQSTYVDELEVMKAQKPLTQWFQGLQRCWALIQRNWIN